MDAGDSEDSDTGGGIEVENEEEPGELFEGSEIGDVTDLEAELGINADDLSSAESETEEVYERNSKRRRTETTHADEPDRNNEEADEVIEDLDEWSEIENDPTTAVEIRYPPEPSEPTRTERLEHEKTHLPYRSWCKVCVMAKGREDPHSETKKLRRQRGPGMAKVGMDYKSLGRGNMQMIIMRDHH